MSGVHALTEEVYLASICSNLSDEDVLRIAAVCPNVRTTLHFARLLATKEPALLLRGVAGTSGLWRHLPYCMVAEFLRDTRELCVSTSSRVILGARQEALRLQHAVREMRRKQPHPPVDFVVIEFKFHRDRAQAFFKATHENYVRSNSLIRWDVMLNLGLYKCDAQEVFLYLRVLPVSHASEACDLHYIALLKVLEGMGTGSEVYLGDWTNASMTNGGCLFHMVNTTWLHGRLSDGTALRCLVAVWHVHGEFNGKRQTWY